MPFSPFKGPLYSLKWTQLCKSIEPYPTIPWLALAAKSHTPRVSLAWVWLQCVSSNRTHTTGAALRVRRTGRSSRYSWTKITMLYTWPSPAASCASPSAAVSATEPVKSKLVFPCALRLSQWHLLCWLRKSTSQLVWFFYRSCIASRDPYCGWLSQGVCERVTIGML